MRHLLLPLLTAVAACGGAPPAVDAPAPAVAQAPGQGAAPVEAAPPPAPAGGGIIGGEPILHRPVVVGAIAVEDVEAGIAAHAAELRRCYEDERAKDATLAGRVLVSFTVARDGGVARATTRSTSLRHPPTEACLNERMAQVRFAPLRDGETALVSYPFSFP